MKKFMRSIITPILFLSPPATMASKPFGECPTGAFLFQGEPATVYAVDLSTGNYRTVSTNTGASGVINAVGFNETGRYICGWNKAAKTITRINQEYRTEDLNLTSGQPEGNNCCRRYFRQQLFPLFTKPRHVQNRFKPWR